MDRNRLHHIVQPLSADWWQMNTALLLGALLLFGMAYRQKSDERKMQLGKVLALCILINLVLSHFYHAFKGNWSLQNNLPLHLCSISAFLAIAALYFKSTAAYEFLIYFSAGAIHSFITPELTHGNGVFEKTDYCISHGGVLLAGIFCTVHLGMKPIEKGWIRIFLYTQLLLPLIGLINYFTDANYMYLCQRPNADNPFIIGNWPWYIVILELFVLLHFWAFYKLHRYLASLRQPEVEATILS